MTNYHLLPERFRLLKAIAIVVAIVVAAPGVDAVARYAATPQRASAAVGGIDAGFLLESGDASTALDRIEGLSSGEAADVPRAFSEEVGFLPDARDVRASIDGAVVGYVVDSGADDALRRLIGHMQLRGWTEVPLGEVEGATFVKREGSCRWALATCTQVGAATNVVVRCVIS